MQSGDLPHERQPDPRPLECAGTRAPHAMESLEKVRQFLRRDARPSVGDGQDSAASVGAQPHDDLALKGELERVGKQVEDDFLPHLAVHMDGRGQWRAINGEAQLRALDRRLEEADEFASERREIGRLVGVLDPACLDAGEVEQIVDEPLEAQAVALCDFQPFPLHRRQRTVDVAERVRDGAEHQREGRAELVADLPKKSVLARSSSASASARRRSSSYARASPIEVAMWPAMRP